MKTLLLSILLVCNLMAVTAEDAAWLLNGTTDFNKAVGKSKNEKSHDRSAGGQRRMQLV